jgi:hypothetical protein
MQNTGNLNSLAEKMKARTEQERLELESLTRQQFAALSKSLSESSKNALSTTEAAIRLQLASLEQNVTSHCRILSAVFGWKCLQALILTLCILMGATLSGWGLLTLAEKKIVTLQREVAELRTAKAALEQSIATWPLALENAPNGRFLIPTPPHTLKTGWTFNNQAAWKLE